MLKAYFEYAGILCFNGTYVQALPPESFVQIPDALYLWRIR